MALFLNSQMPCPELPVSLVTVGILPQLEPSYLPSEPRGLEEEGTRSHFHEEQRGPLPAMDQSM